MNKALLCLIGVLTSFTLFAQQEGLDLRAETDTTFGAVNLVSRFAYHPLYRLGNSLYKEDSKGQYQVGFVASMKEVAVSANSTVHALFFETIIEEPKIRVNIDPEKIVTDDVKSNFNIMDPFGHGSSLWAFNRGAIAFWKWWFYGGVNLNNSAADSDNILVKLDYTPMEDRQYLNRIALLDISSFVIPEIAPDKILGLPEFSPNVEKGVYLPLWKRGVHDVFELISMAHYDQGFDFTIYPKDKEYSYQVLQGRGISNPGQKQVIIEAERQKLIAYFNWAMRLPDTAKALERLGFVIAANDPRDANVNFIYNWARMLSERKLLNPGKWEADLEAMTRQQKLDEKPLYWPDVYIGAQGVSTYSVSAGSFSLFSNPMLNFGVGYNFGESFVYADGLVGGNSSALAYVAKLQTNFRFVDFFELNTSVSYDQSGKVQVVPMPNFILFDFFQIGGMLYVDVMPALKVDFGARLGFGDLVDLQVKYDTKATSTAISAGLKF